MLYWIKRSMSGEREKLNSLYQRLRREGRIADVKVSLRGDRSRSDDETFRAIRALLEQFDHDQDKGGKGK